MSSKHKQSVAHAKRIAVWSLRTVNASIADILTLLYPWVIRSRVNLSPARLRAIATRAHARHHAARSRVAQ